MDLEKGRSDGRQLHEVRPIFLKTGVVSQAKGSAYIEMNKTKLVCAVYGPRHIPKKSDIATNGLLNVEFKFAPFSCLQRRQSQPDSEEKELSLLLKQALEPAVCLHTFPNARLDVYILVLENAGSVVAATITCAGLALADSGIEMFDSVVGCSLKQIENRSYIDPTHEEEIHQTEKANGLVTLGYMPNRHQITTLIQTGKIPQHTLTKAIKCLMDGCQHIYPLLRDCLVKSFQKQTAEAQ